MYFYSLIIFLTKLIIFTYNAIQEMSHFTRKYKNI